MLLEGPPNVLADQGRRVILALPQGGDHSRRARCIAECDRHIAQPALEADSPDRAAAGLVQEFRFAPGEQCNELRPIEVMAHAEILLCGRTRELVPGTDELAVVASIDAIAHGAPELERNRTGEFDREI